MKNLFEKYICKVLTETPWIEFNDSIFDLELENKFTKEIKTKNKTNFFIKPLKKFDLIFLSSRAR